MDDTVKQPAISEALSDGEEPKQETKSSTSAAAAAVWSTANDDCILFGRGKGCNNHPANKRMRLVIEGYRDRYQGAGRGGKRKVVHEIYRELVEAGMKFLKQEEGLDGWVEADADEAIKKVGHAMRCPRIRIRNEADLGDQSNVASGFSAAAYRFSHARADTGDILENNSAGIGRESISGLLGALPSMSAVVRAGFLSRGTLGHQETPRVALPVLSDPLLSLGRIPMQMNLTSLYAGASASMGFAAPAMGLNGLSSSLELLVMVERERQFREAMLSIINPRRNTEQR
ncbi:unnamed protein product [Cylindrotheca closterium]|uniref:DUF6824 domain-containing protein n=1 Tax=Cylindrotheca closterium TaxID=2856 RepID=A0AAD2JPX9_9STRA|nr:unnamed protein product [Cylindrotheca closterium]CAJ1969490.1 unnamed protein product [Cylindrotheca closterium]